MRLILLDLLFIILNAADLALAFNVLYDNQAGCLSDTNSGDVFFPHCDVRMLMLDTIFRESVSTSTGDGKCIICYFNGICDQFYGIFVSV